MVCHRLGQRRPLYGWIRAYTSYNRQVTSRLGGCRAFLIRLSGWWSYRRSSTIELTFGHLSKIGEGTMSKAAKSERAAKAGQDGPARSFRVSGRLLTSLRLARGWTQLEAADRAGISERLIRKAEAGESLGLRSIAILADLYSTAQSPLSLDGLVSEPLGAALYELGIESIARRWHNELWNLGRLEIVDELAVTDCVLHAHDRYICGHAAVRRYIRSTRAAMGDFKLVAQPPTVFSDLAVTRWRLRLKNPPPQLAGGSGDERSVIRGSTWIRVADGLLCEAWKYWHFSFPVPAPRGKG